MPLDFIKIFKLNYILIFAAVYLGIMFFYWPIKKFMKFVFGSLLNVGILFVVNYCCTLIHIAVIGINWITILITCVLGVPGIATLLLVQNFILK